MTILHHSFASEPAPRPRGWLLETAVVVGILAVGYFVLMFDSVPRPSAIPAINAGIDSPL